MEKDIKEKKESNPIRSDVSHKSNEVTGFGMNLAQVTSKLYVFKGTPSVFFLIDF